MRFRNRTLRSKGVGAILDLTPIVDMVFNLLLFFAVSLNFSATAGGIKVKLPSSSTAEHIRAERVMINLTRDLKTYLNDKPVSEAQLRRKLEAMPDKKSLVVIRADDLVPHGVVVRTMDVVKASGFSRLAIAVEKGPPPAAPRR